MKNHDEETWLKKIKDSLQDYSQPPPPDGWRKLNKELLTPVFTEKRIYSYRIWTSAAAIAVLAISAISIYFLRSPMADEIRQTPLPVVSVIPDVIPESNLPETLTARVEPVNKKMVSSVTIKASVNQIEEIPENKEEVPDIIESNQNQIPEDVIVQDVYSRERTHPQRTRYNPPAVTQKNTSRKKWSFGVSVNSTSGLNSDESLIEYSSGTTKMLTSAAANGMASIPRESVVTFENGVPILVNSAYNEYDWKHNQPVSFGLSVRRQIANQISIESGLVYTYLKSETKSGVYGSQKLDQKLHYLGLPVRINWDFYETGRIAFYTAGGFIVEKCVYGKTGTAKNTVKPMQFSLNAAVGGQLNISKAFGIYFEPGVAYFFDDGSEVATIRKENKFNINLQAGVRFTY